MKTNIGIVAFFSAAVLLTPAHATSVLFTATTALPSAGNYSSPLSLTLSYGAGSINAYGYDDVFPTNPKLPVTATPPVSGATPEGLTVQKDLSGAEGLGVNNTNVGQDNGFVAPSDAVMLDFSHVHPTANNGSGAGSINQITFNLYEDYSGADYEVYGLVSGTANTSGAVWAPVTSGIMQNKTTLTVQTTSLYSEYVIGVTDCALDIQSVAVQYSGASITDTPEPGTFVMAGMAFIVIGVATRKSNNKA